MFNIAYFKKDGNIIHRLSNFIINGFSKTFEEREAKEAKIANQETRNLLHNNPFVSATARAYKRGVSSTEWNIQSRTAQSDFNKTFESLIREWSKRGNCELTGRFYRGSAEKALVAEYAVLSGGFIIKHHFSNYFKFGYKFEIIPLSYINTSKIDSLNNIFNGIKIDKSGQIKSIFLFNRLNKDITEEVNYKDLTLVVDIWADPSQYTGATQLAPILESLEYIDSYKSSEMDGAKQRADTPILIKTPFFNTLIKAEEISASKKLNVQQIKELFDLRRKDQKEVTKGFSYISDDEDVVETGKSVDSIYSDMYKNETRGASAGVGLSSTSSVGDMPSSYNATLKFAQDEEREFKSVFQDIIELCWREVIEVRLLNGLVLKGLINPDNYWESPEQYRNIEFMRKEIDHIDPVKTQKAITESLNNGSSNLVKILASKGVDYKDHISQEVQYEIEKQNQYEKAGLKCYKNEIKCTIGDDFIAQEENND
jgi:capsid protein